MREAEPAVDRRAMAGSLVDTGHADECDRDPGAVVMVADQFEASRRVDNGVGMRS